MHLSVLSVHLITLSPYYLRYCKQWQISLVGGKMHVAIILFLIDISYCVLRLRKHSCLRTWFSLWFRACLVCLERRYHNADEGCCQTTRSQKSWHNYDTMPCRWILESEFTQLKRQHSNQVTYLIPRIKTKMYSIHFLTSFHSQMFSTYNTTSGQQMAAGNFAKQKTIKAAKQHKGSVPSINFLK